LKASSRSTGKGRSFPRIAPANPGIGGAIRQIIPHLSFATARALSWASSKLRGDAGGEDLLCFLIRPRTRNGMRESNAKQRLT
jgi:hypothetical protein